MSPNTRKSQHARKTLQENTKRRAFTLIELAVVMAIIAVLASLIVPALNQVRQTARRVECQNNLKNLGVAFFNHESKHGHLPKDAVNQWGIGVFILPQLEQSVLYEKIRPLTSKRDETHKWAVNTRLGIFRCPLFNRKAPALPDGTARSNYQGNKELFSYGAMSEDIRDGASNTIMMAEVTSELGWALPGLVGISNRPNEGGMGGAGGGIGSDHAAGANFLLADGSVKFINDAVGLATFKALGTIAAGDNVNDF